LFPAAIIDSLCHVWKLLLVVLIVILLVGRDVGTDLLSETSTSVHVKAKQNIPDGQELLLQVGAVEHDVSSSSFVEAQKSCCAVSIVCGFKIVSTVTIDTIVGITIIDGLIVGGVVCCGSGGLQTKSR
jgi:hypothetical protein